MDKVPEAYRDIYKNIRGLKIKTKHRDIIKPIAKPLPIEIKNIYTPTNIFTFSDRRKNNLFAVAEAAAPALLIQKLQRPVSLKEPKIPDREKESLKPSYLKLHMVVINEVES
ncbi:hypothetical protein NPIL_21791 [Nephila pilipes]|uniref:Uncharacterized protein n=1 Tax=Nephila pilipes TaxID=299642 RepID=A0A8X6TV78_NEPPI|nr:hypothetical protein NPIL_21791 [Nephila pilipes]